MKQCLKIEHLSIQQLFYQSLKGYRIEQRFMHIMTKITLGVGTVLLIGSIIAMVVGGGSFFDDFAENPNGIEKWSGTSPTTYEGDFEVMSIYYVFVEDGATVDVELVGGDSNSRFIPCGENGDCNFYEWAGYTYVGDISVMTEGTWEVEFTGNGDVMIREQVIDFSGIMAMGLGFWGTCCSICVLGLGVIFIFTLKDNKAQQGVMMVQQADGTIQPVGGMPMQQPGVAAPMVGGAIHPAFANQQSQTLPPIGGQQPPNQGF